MLDRGVCVAGGSDAPIETCAPLVGMYDAIYRQARPSSTSEGGSGAAPGLASSSLQRAVFRPEEALTFSEALWIYTVGAARAAGSETFLGSLEVGYAADFVVLDAGILEDSRLLMTAQPDMVVVGGHVSYSKWAVSQPQTDPNLDLHDSSEDAAVLCGVVSMGGPYVPGKNGKQPRLFGSGSFAQDRQTCACSLLGRYCRATQR